MSWYGTFDSVFFITGATLIVGMVGMCARLAYKSKCSDIDVCWGAIKIKRDVAQEDRIPTPVDVETGTPPTPLAIDRRGTIPS
jgi:hypothetical protein